THSSGRSYSNELRQDEAKLTRRENLDGRPLIVLTTKARQVRPNIQYYLYREFWIDLGRGVVVRRQTFAREAENSHWRLQFRQESGDFEWDAGLDLWLPTLANEFQWHVKGQGQGKLLQLEVFVYSDWEINPQFDAETFSIDQTWYSQHSKRMRG
ncbi:MAG: hypothetical protein ABI557_11960, partial [Aureliella sp.]